MSSVRCSVTDGVRTTSIYVIVAIHAMVTSRWICQTEIKNPVLNHKIFSIFKDVIQFGLPLLFFCSGRSAEFLNKKYGDSVDIPLLRYLINFCGFILKKLTRLIIPGIFAYFLIVIPDAYISQSYRIGISDFKGRSNNFFTFFTNVVSSFQDGLSWLWFLPTLFLISVINYPLTSGRMGLLFIWGLIFWGLFLWLLLLGRRPDDWYSYIEPLVAVLPYFSMAIFGANEIRFPISFVTVIFSSLMLAIIPFTKNETVPMLTLNVIFYNFYYIAGALSTRVKFDFLTVVKKMSTISRVLAYCLFTLFFVITAPHDELSEGELWYRFPVYNRPAQCFAMVFGSWLWLVLLWIFGRLVFEPQTPELFSSGSTVHAQSMIMYLTHWLCIDIAVRLIIFPVSSYNFTNEKRQVLTGTDLNFWFVWSLLSISGWTISWLFYISLQWVSSSTGISFSAIGINAFKDVNKKLSNKSLLSKPEESISETGSNV